MIVVVVGVGVVATALATIPNEPDLFQLSNPIRCHRTGGTVLVLFVLPSLPLGPNSELRVAFKVARDDTVPVHTLVLQQILEAFFPHNIVAVPNKADFVEETDAFLREGAPFPIDFQFVLVPLSLYPLCQS